jgi:hypothetical protein
LPEQDNPFIDLSQSNKRSIIKDEKISLKKKHFKSERILANEQTDVKRNQIWDIQRKISIHHIQNRLTAEPNQNNFAAHSNKIS